MWGQLQPSDEHQHDHSSKFFGSLETELIDRSSWRTRAHARLAVFDYIEAFHSPKRRHSGLGYLSPAEFERRYRSEQQIV